MSEAEKLKEEIGWLKVVFGILVASDISLLAWLAQNFAEALHFLVTICLVAELLVTIGIVGVNRAAYRKINELGKL